MSKGKILVVDDEISIREFLEIMLKRESYDVSCAASGPEALEIVKTKNVDVVLSDMNMPEMDGIALLQKIKEGNSGAVVIIMTAYGSAESAVQAMKAGASDYISKPFQIDELLVVLDKCLKNAKLEVENQQLRKQLQREYSFESIIGNSERMQEVFGLIRRVSKTEANVLILGESGTGKELVANAIHNHSNLKDKPFVTVNCGAIQESLLESEMFGHKRGSFTGAVTDKKGLFEIANGGTLFLDEVGELSLAIQVKLLRAIQTRTFRMVGGTEDIHVDIRIICATNRDLEAAVKTKEFREDLYYRLNVIQIRMPALRERTEDIPLIANHFCMKFTRHLGKGPMQISAEAMRYLTSYPFPGNVRELENTIERAVALATGPIILPENLPPRLREYQQQSGNMDTRGTTTILLDLPPVPPNLPPHFNLEAKMEDYEKRYILCALEQAGGVKSQAAKLLGLSFRSLRYRIAKYNIADNDPTEEQGEGDSGELANLKPFKTESR